MPNEFVCKDHPQANGRSPQAGEREFTLTFPLEDGSNLKLRCGQETFDRFAEMIGSMAIDDQAESDAPTVQFDFTHKPIVTHYGQTEPVWDDDTLWSKEGKILLNQRIYDFEYDNKRLHADNDRLKEENLELRKSILNQAGDNSCHLKGDEVALPPWADFRESCLRHWKQITNKQGELSGCRTIAQLEAEVRRLEGLLLIGQEFNPVNGIPK